MSDAPGGPGWWQASDLRWYPPEPPAGPRPVPPGRLGRHGPVSGGPGGSRRRTVALSAAGVAVVAVIGVAVALALGNGTASRTSIATSTTAPATTAPATTVPATTVPATTVPATTVPATTVPATTVPATTVPATTVPATTVPATTVPATTAPAAPVATPCDATALFAAAVAKEGFNPTDPSYAQMGAGQAAGAYQPTCAADWAIATISRPNVGTTDGATLFHALEGSWAEVSVLGAPLTSCTLTGQGVPQPTAVQLMTALGGKTTC